MNAPKLTPAQVVMLRRLALAPPGWVSVDASVPQATCFALKDRGYARGDWGWARTGPARMTMYRIRVTRAGRAAISAFYEAAK